MPEREHASLNAIPDPSESCNEWATDLEVGNRTTDGEDEPTSPALVHYSGIDTTPARDGNSHTRHGKFRGAATSDALQDGATADLLFNDLERGRADTYNPTRQSYKASLRQRLLDNSTKRIQRGTAKSRTTDFG